MLTDTLIMYVENTRILNDQVHRISGMEARDQIIEELDDIPRQHYREILKFIRALKKISVVSEKPTMYASESSLKKDWMRPEEDEAWADL